MTAEWRPMRPVDLPAAERIAAVVHPDFPEDETVFAERLALYPEGCRLLVGEGEALGYAITHPWRRGEPPALNSLLGALPARPDTYYIHDLALLPGARGGGAAGRLVTLLAEQARGLPGMSLVAVNGSVPFWRRQGFSVVREPRLAAKLRSYDAEACLMERPLAG